MLSATPGYLSMPRYPTLPFLELVLISSYLFVIAARLRYLRHQAFLTRSMIGLFRIISECHIAVVVSEFTGSPRSARHVRQLHHLICLLQRWFCTRHLFWTLFRIVASILLTHDYLISSFLLRKYTFVSLYQITFCQCVRCETVGMLFYGHSQFWV